jgi:hypothetical protein
MDECVNPPLPALLAAQEVHDPPRVQFLQRVLFAGIEQHKGIVRTAALLTLGHRNQTKNEVALTGHFGRKATDCYAGNRRRLCNKK